MVMLGPSTNPCRHSVLKMTRKIFSPPEIMTLHFTIAFSIILRGKRRSALKKPTSGLCGFQDFSSHLSATNSLLLPRAHLTPTLPCHPQQPWAQWETLDTLKIRVESVELLLGAGLPPRVVRVEASDGKRTTRRTLKSELRKRRNVVCQTIPGNEWESETSMTR